MSITLRFESEQERNKWMDQAHPIRRCTNVPGLFVTPTHYLSVRWLKVEVTQRARFAKKGPK